MCMSRVGDGRVHFFRYISCAEFLGVQNLHFDSKLVFLFLGGGSENSGMKVFVDIFGVTSKIEFFMFCFPSKINYRYL